MGILGLSKAVRAGDCLEDLGLEAAQPCTHSLRHTSLTLTGSEKARASKRDRDRDTQKENQCVREI